MPKISIYVPDDMKTRMDEAGDRANWSGIAQRAFGFELNHLESVKEISSMTDVIERLRSSKEKNAEFLTNDGRTAGRDWAMRRAEYDELRRVANLDADLIRQVHQEQDLAAFAVVIEAIVGDRDEAREILKRESDIAELLNVDEDVVDTLTYEWFAGFVEGVQAVWEEVADKI